VKVRSYPSPLGQAFATINNFKRLPLTDRLSIAGLLVAMLDLNRNDAVYEQYDGIDALTLFKQLRISDRMINEFLRPILLVGLFKPPEELSAAVTMELLYYYALAHQDSFDVRWIKSKSIAEQLLAPLSQRLAQPTSFGRSRRNVGIAAERLPRWHVGDLR
jgi:uncharacterized protein with NAD-binding domain and iron-sulfur cluster